MYRGYFFSSTNGFLLIQDFHSVINRISNVSMMFIPSHFSFPRRIDLLYGYVQSVSHRSVAQIADDGDSLLFARGLIVSSVLDLTNINIAVTLRQCVYNKCVY
jgi:hypothetical protein